MDIQYGYNFLPYLTGKEKKGPRKEFFSFTDDGALSAIRVNDWKVMFSEQRANGISVWRDPRAPLVPLGAPKIFNLRRDPFERAGH